MSSTLFVAALAHGIVILGITFTTSPLPETDALAPINVTLLLDTDKSEKPVDTDLLAQRNQTGAGRLERSDRPTRALAAEQPVSQAGDPLGADLLDGTPREQAPTPEELASSGESVDAVSPATTEQPAATQTKAANLLHDIAPPTLATEVDLKTVSTGNDSDAKIASPSTSEAVVAAYLVGWRQRVERIGTANFPEGLLARGAQLGRPTLEVAIGPEGDIEEIVVRKSSGDSTLDQAALKILRMAAPFEPLPPGITSKYKVLRFAYEWDFTLGDKG